MRNEYNHFSNANRLFYKALHIVVICILMSVGAMPLSAQVYSTAQRYTPYDSHTNAAYGASYNSNGYAEQPAYNSYQSTVHQPFASSPSMVSGRRNTGDQPPQTGGGNPTNPDLNDNDPGGGELPDGWETPSDPGHQSNQSPVGEAWILLLFAAAAAWVVFRRQQREKKHIAIYSENQQQAETSNMKQHIRKSLFISIILLAGVSNAWADKGFFTDQQWKIGYWDGTSDKWSDYKNNNTQLDLGIQTTLFLKGSNVQTWCDQNEAYPYDHVVWYWGWSNQSMPNNVYSYDHKNKRGNQQWYFPTNYDLISNAPNKVGHNTLYMYWKVDNYKSSSTSRITFTIPGFTTTSTSQAFDNTTVGSNSSNTISFGTHYGTALTTNNCSLSGTNKAEFKVTSINESGVTVQFAPTSAGNKTAKLTITDAHGKTCTITLSGKTQYTITYSKGTYGTGNNVTDNKVYGTNLILKDKGLFTRNHYTQTAWNTNTNGTGGTSYDLKASYTKDQAATLYPTWTPTSYNISYSNLGDATHNNPTTYTIETPTITFEAPTTNRTGYTFASWNPASIAKGSTGNKTITANWTPKTYTVTLNPQNGESTTSITATYDAAMPAITIPTRTGYTFGGYYTSINGGGTQYYKADGKSARTWNIANDNTTLYAKWTAIEYTITYENLGGATHSNPDTYTIEDAITFSAPSDRNGYNFTGWIPASIAKGSTGNKTVTATWQEKPANTIYFKPQSWWKDNDAKFAVYAWVGGENTWIDFEYDDCTGNIYMADIPSKYTQIKIVRLKPSTHPEFNSTNNGYCFENKWNETSDLNIPTNNKNLYDLTQEYIYLKPNDNWKSDGARFAAYFFGNGEKWVDMTDADGDGYYSCEKPDGYDWVIFCRMNPATSANNWNNRWNQSANQGIPENNLFTVNDGQWGGKGEDNNKDGATGHWDNNHWDNSQWTTYTAPTFDVTISAATNGTIKVVYKGQTYTSGQTISNVPIHSELTITFTPAEGYELTTPLVTYADVVADDIYSICGPTVISAEFVARGNTKVIYLRPNDDWLKDNPIFIAHAWKNGSSDQHDYLMTTKDTDYTGSYSCTIDSKYDHVLFARINPEYKTNQELKAEWMWNKTINLQITNDVLEEHGYRFAINSDKMVGTLYDGDWEQNTPIWGLTSDFNNWHAEDAVFMGYPGKINILLSAASHEFKLYNFRHGDYYGNTSTYQRTNSGQWWTMDNNIGNNCTVVADIDNEAYLFQLQLVTETGTYKKQISITYPDFSGGAYRLAYRDNTPNSFHPAHLIRCNTQKDLQLDTISFFVRHDKEPEILLQQCSSADVYTDNPVWTTLAIYPATSSFPSGDNPNNAQLPGKRASDATIHIGEGCGVTSTAVYNFILQQTNTGEHSEALDTRATHLYEGEYYIRTNYAEGGWANYLEPSNLMTYSSYADHYEPFSYYFCKWVNPKNKNEAKANITYTIANPYSRCISDTLIGDAIIAKNGVTEGYLPDSANVRFTWDHETNALARAYIAGSGHKKDRFLVLEGNESLLDINGKRFTGNTAEGQDRYNLTDDEVVFDDMGNWIYQMDVKANKDTKIDLTAKYNNLVQYFKGGSKDEDEILLIVTTNDNEKYYKIRIIYDFKTNHLISAWLPEDETITTDEQLGADMMIIRHNQEKAEQLNFNPLSSSLTKVGTAYAVMTFDKYFLNNKDKTGNELAEKKSENERKFYWISFPFDVKLSEVFGFGEYGDQWIMEYYDGEARAKEGYWAETETFWKYITNKNYVLKAGQGYVLCLNLNKMGFTSTVFAHTTEVSLYFPSTGPLNTITGELPNAVTVPAHECTIERDNRNIYDSNWNLIGVPGFADIEEVTIGGSSHTEFNDDIHADCVSFYYKYLPATNKYDATNNEENFQTMYAYMVQFAGTINWRAKTMPAQLAARRTGSMPSQHDLRLEIAQGEQTDQTFVQLKEADATAEFDMNIDMTKIFNSGMNIYTLTGSNAIQVAGNALPMEKATVPVGVRVDAAGEYTFRMPDGTDGIAVTLVDNATGTHTNMLMSEYTVTLNAGTIENRFYLVVDPDRTATSVENVGEEAKGEEAKDQIKKFLIDGKLFIRTADGIFDAKGQRL